MLVLVLPLAALAAAAVCEEPPPLLLNLLQNLLLLLLLLGLEALRQLREPEPFRVGLLPLPLGQGELLRELGHLVLHLAHHPHPLLG